MIIKLLLTYEWKLKGERDKVWEVWKNLWIFCPHGKFWNSLSSCQLIILGLPELFLCPSTYYLWNLKLYHTRMRNEKGDGTWSLSILRMTRVNKDKLKRVNETADGETLTSSKFLKHKSHIIRIYEKSYIQFHT